MVKDTVTKTTGWELLQHVGRIKQRGKSSLQTLLQIKRITWFSKHWVQFLIKPPFFRLVLRTFLGYPSTAAPPTWGFTCSDVDSWCTFTVSTSSMNPGPCSLLQDHQNPANPSLPLLFLADSTVLPFNPYFCFFCQVLVFLSVSPESLYYPLHQNLCLIPLLKWKATTTILTSQLFQYILT